MNKTYKDLHRAFCARPHGTPECERIEQNYQKLIHSLSKKNRRRMLRIIDDKDMLLWQASLDGFTAGLQLGLAISSATREAVE